MVKPLTCSVAGTAASRPAALQRLKAPAPGNHGITPRTSTSHSLASAVNCCWLNGDHSGSTGLRNSRVSTTTRIGAPILHDARITLLDMLSLYLVRHGQTDYSLHNKLCGSIDPPLNPHGLAMA